MGMRLERVGLRLVQELMLRLRDLGVLLEEVEERTKAMGLSWMGLSLGFPVVLRVTVLGLNVFEGMEVTETFQEAF